MDSSPGSAKLYIWSNQLLFLGATCIAYRSHSVVSDKLLVSLEGDMIITQVNGQNLLTRSVLLRAGTSFASLNLDTSAAVVAIYYLPALSQDHAALESVMTRVSDCLHYGHPQEAELIKRLLHIREAGLPPGEAQLMLREYLMPPELEGIIFREYDPRIVSVIQRIRETVSENLSVQMFAAEVHLSASRLEKLFKEQIGVPITRYRLRYRVFVGVIHLALGESITSAALAAGFASSAHFSKSYSAIHGIAPSARFLKPPMLEVLLADEIFGAGVPVVNESAPARAV
ncbi:AraC family transcriptional regulator [Allohahella marinimesophila]|uniref:HTH araC/xylS-type domain-containing protein n=1 Tax=Allohahella marinimesophila TaxID=1054972 RepID=A0ABP7NZE5_9GAMM